jgi:hypothetical protein
MFKKFRISYNLIRVSFQYIKRDWELLVYSILSLLSALVILATFAWVDIFFLGNIQTFVEGAETSQATSDIIIYAYIFIYYLVFSFIAFFFNTAIITSVQRRIEWKDNKLWDGLRDSIKHIKAIFIWSLINAIVSTILNILQNMFKENSIVGRIIVGLIGWAWNILTFFSFPLMIINGVWPKDAIKESASLFKKTWWERAIIHVWVGFLFFLLYLVVLALSIFIIYIGFVITWVVLIVLWMLFLIILSSTCNVIIKTILLSYAQNGKIPDGIENGESITDIAW